MSGRHRPDVGKRLPIFRLLADIGPMWACLLGITQLRVNPYRIPTFWSAVYRYTWCWDSLALRKRPVHSYSVRRTQLKHYTFKPLIMTQIIHRRLIIHHFSICVLRVCMFLTLIRLKNDPIYSNKQKVKQTQQNRNMQGCICLCMLHCISTVLKH